MLGESSFFGLINTAPSTKATQVLGMPTLHAAQTPSPGLSPFPTFK